MEGLPVLLLPRTAAVVGEEVELGVALAAVAGEFVQALEAAVLGGVGGVKSKLVVVLAAAGVDFPQNGL